MSCPSCGNPRMDGRAINYAKCGRCGWEGVVYHRSKVEGSLRDQFAMAALTGLLYRRTYTSPSEVQGLSAHDQEKFIARMLTKASYELADAMMVAREKKNG